MGRCCQFTGKRNNTANNVSHSKRATKRVQKAHILKKRLFVPSEKRWVTVRVSAAALRSIEKMGMDEYLRKTGAVL